MLSLSLTTARRLVVVLDQRVNVYALETLEKLCTLETAANPKVQACDRGWLIFNSCVARQRNAERPTLERH